MLTFIVGLTEKDASRFEASKQTILTMAVEKSLAAALQVSRIKRAGTWAAYRVGKSRNAK
jgi:hypothetical protein